MTEEIPVAFLGFRCTERGLEQLLRFDRAGTSYVEWHPVGDNLRPVFHTSGFKPKWSHLPWEKVNWEKTDAQISADFSVPNTVVARERRRREMPSPLHVVGKVMNGRIPYLSKVDWSQRDVVLSIRFNLSR